MLRTGSVPNFGRKLVPTKHNAILNEGLLSISHNYEGTYVAHLLLYLVRIYCGSSLIPLIHICSSHLQGLPGIEIHTVTGDKEFSDHTSDSTGYNSHFPSNANTSDFQARLDLLRNGKKRFLHPTNSLPHMTVVSIVIQIILEKFYIFNGFLNYLIIIEQIISPMKLFINSYLLLTKET